MISASSEISFSAQRSTRCSTGRTSLRPCLLRPPYSHVGLREWEAVEKGYRIKVVRLPASANTRAQILNQTEGLLKAVVNAETNQILGCSLLCIYSSELINLVQMAINANLDYTVLRDNIYTHPTMSEALNDLFAKL